MKHSILILLLAFTSHLQARENYTFVLVHGALFTSDSWAPLQTELGRRGIATAATDMPGRKGDGVDIRSITIETAATKVCQVVSAQAKRVILVGHSQGGAVINQALKFCAERIVGLVYVAAVAPKSGTIAFAALDPKRDVNFAKCAPANPEKGLFELNQNGPLAKSFFQELAGKKQGDAAVASMVSEPMGIGTTPLNFPEEVYTRIPKIYILTQNDQILTAVTQANIVNDIANIKVKRVSSGHSPQITHTKKVAKLLEEFSSGLHK